MSELDKSWVPPPGTVLAERYKLGAVIDEGGMGVILKASHLHLGRDVAVKLLHPDVASKETSRARFRREVQVIAGIDHPNIVRCHDVGDMPDGAMFFVMELLQGRSLKQALLEDGRFGSQRMVAISLQLADALAAAHRVDVVHRDLKPANVFLVRDLRGREVVKLLDFGLAKSITTDDVEITQDGMILGTASYLAPELLLSAESVPAGDVYACGLMMVEMLTGEKVFGAQNTAQTFLQQLSLGIRIPARVWESELGNLIRSMVEKHPADRPSDADFVYRELTQITTRLPEYRLTDAEVPPPRRADEMGSLDAVPAEGASIDVLRAVPGPERWGEWEQPLDQRQTTAFVVKEEDLTVLDQPIGEAVRAVIEPLASNEPSPTAFVVKEEDLKIVDTQSTVEVPPVVGVPAFAEPEQLEPLWQAIAEPQPPTVMEVIGPVARKKWRGPAIVLAFARSRIGLLIALLAFVGTIAWFVRNDLEFAAFGEFATWLAASDEPDVIDAGDRGDLGAVAADMGVDAEDLAEEKPKKTKKKRKRRTKKPSKASPDAILEKHLRGIEP